MRPALRAILTTTFVVGALVLAAVLVVSPSDATTGSSCKNLAVGPGWSAPVKVARHPTTVMTYAPDGYLIDAYCVKSGGGPEAAVVVSVQPPQASAVVDHPTRPHVDEYALHLVPISSGSGGPTGTDGPADTGGPSTPPDTGGPTAPSTG